MTLPQGLHTTTAEYPLLKSYKPPFIGFPFHGLGLQPPHTGPSTYLCVPTFTDRAGTACPNHHAPLVVQPSHLSLPRWPSPNASFASTALGPRPTTLLPWIRSSRGTCSPLCHLRQPQTPPDALPTHPLIPPDGRGLSLLCHTTPLLIALTSRTSALPPSLHRLLVL